MYGLHARRPLPQFPRWEPRSRSHREPGALIRTPRSVPKQHASRSISAPFACMGKFRSVGGWGRPRRVGASRTPSKEVAPAIAVSTTF